MTAQLRPVRPDAEAPSTEQARPARWRLGYNPGLDGLRAVGMTVMLAYHGELAWARGAYLALSQFFTLSGFLVGSVLLQDVDTNGGVRLRRFWVRRVRRLWPASLAALAGIALYGATVADASQADALPRQVAAAAVQFANWFFVVEDTSYVNQFAAPSPVQHFWSLSVEEQFYLLLPLGLVAVLACSRSRRVLGATVAGVAALCTAWMVHLHSSGAGVDRIYYGTDTRLPEMLTGFLLAVVMSRARAPRPSSRPWTVVAWAGAVGYVASVWMFGAVGITEPLMWRGGIVAFSLLTCLVIAGVLSGAGPLRVLSWGPLPAVGRMTYGLYLYHLPVFLWLTAERTGLSQWPLFGLRVLVTFAVATVSYHLLEMPIRRGTVLTAATGRRLRFLLGPVVAVSVVALTFVTAGRAADDKWGTLRDVDAASAAPSGGDPVLDVLVITDPVGEPIADHLEAMAAEDPALAVVRGGAFDCGDLTGAPPERVCTTWRDTWPALVEVHDPDVVFLFVDTWEKDLARLAGRSGTSPTDLAVELLDSGLDLLTARGANVVWGTNPERLLDPESRREMPFRVAMRSLLQSRSDLRPTQYIPEVPPDPDAAYLSRATAIVREALQVHRRRAAGDKPRVMVVGDSQARSVGYGLERLAADTGDAVVWNVAVPGCGLVNTGVVRDAVTDAVTEPDPSCIEAIAAWPANVAEFDPDIVLVLTSLRDVQDRRLGDDGFRSIGDAGIDDLVLSTYIDAVDTLSAEGATVVWMKPPCVRYVSPFGGDGRAPAAFEPERIQRLNDHVLPALARARPSVVLYDLDEVLCPGGEFLERTDGVPEVRPDGVHPSVEASLWLAELLQEDVVERYAG